MPAPGAVARSHPTPRTAGRPREAGRWSVEWNRGPAAAFHGRSWPEPAPRAWVFEVTAPALVLGSTQDGSTADADRVAAAGVELVRRRSGGGAVLVRPGEAVWLDVLVPAGDRLWRADVSRAGHWLGQVWADALADLGVDARWHDGPLVSTPWSRLVCFAGLGPGEVTAGGAKVVGISQRRTRAGALFQCAALLGWDPEALLALLALDDRSRAAGAAALAGSATGLGVDRHALESSVLARLAGA